MILITGATGPVGSEVVKRLSAQGIQVRAVTRDWRKAEASPLPHVEFVKGDFDDFDSMRRACTGMERAFLLSNSTERAEQQQTAFVEVGCPAHREALPVARSCELARTVSSLSRRSRGRRTSCRSEFHVSAPEPLHAGLLNFAPSIKEKSAFFAAAGEACISAVDVRDLADVAAAALTGSQHDNKSYSLTGPEALTFGEMAKQLSVALGRTITFVDVPPEAMRGALASLGFPAWQADGLLEEFAMYRRGEAAGVESGVLEALGRGPRSFAEFARDYAPLLA
jgi:uncharacterized protein YbjT (DUF2867 family)